MASSQTPKAARDLLYAAFKTYWDGTAYAAVKIAWDNIDSHQDGSEYLRIQGQHIAGTIASLGNEHYRRQMLFIVNIFTPEGQGQQRSDELGEAVLAFIETLDLGNFRVRDPGFNEVGVFDGYYQSSVSADLEYDALRT
jgi:hypothetical protein